MKKGILILDFGSQYTQLIARRIRELGTYAEILAFNASLDEIKKHQPAGIILSGGPNSVFEDGAPVRSVDELSKIAPLLGICYGMQLISHQLGGKVESAEHREYGSAEIFWDETESKKNSWALFWPAKHKVWMSHGDVVSEMPPGFTCWAKSENHLAAIRSSRIWAVQFHPEVTHSEHGEKFLKSFLEFTQAEQNWSTPLMLEHLLQEIKEKIPANEKILCALSGGVDSTVVATLLTRALGAERVECVFVDTGLLRYREFENVIDIYKQLGLHVHGINAADEFFAALKGVSDPERKRKIIGHLFIDVFKKSMQKIGHLEWLAQGTLYPDVIESVSLRGTSVTIKSHHNVGGLPKDLGLKLIEPVRELFKDEVRKIGELLNIPKDVLMRHPFPGPGLAIRVLGELNKEDVEIVRQADRIWIEELRKSEFYNKVWQAFCVLLPVRTVGVQGDSRTYDRVLALRSVTSIDGMTADWFDFPGSFIRKVSSRITNEVKGVNRVVYDVTSKPPGTIEWE